MKIATMFFRLTRDVYGSVLVEVSIMLPILIFFVFGSIDFLFAFYEWNAATKAVQVGARIAAVSNPVVTNLNALSAALASRTLRPGSAMPVWGPSHRDQGNILGRRNLELDVLQWVSSDTWPVPSI